MLIHTFLPFFRKPLTYYAPIVFLNNLGKISMDDESISVYACGTEYILYKWIKNTCISTISSTAFAFSFPLHCLLYLCWDSHFPIWFSSKKNYPQTYVPTYLNVCMCLAKSVFLIIRFMDPRCATTATWQKDCYLHSHLAYCINSIPRQFPKRRK